MSEWTIRPKGAHYVVPSTEGRTAPKDALRRISQAMFGDGHGCSTQAVDEILNPSEAISHLDLQAQISTPVDTWTYCAVHDHCTLTEDLNDSQGVRWCIKAADDGETCDLRALTAGGRA